jgi:hypothetical protein
VICFGLLLCNIENNHTLSAFWDLICWQTKISLSSFANIGKYFAIVKQKILFSNIANNYLPQSADV